MNMIHIHIDSDDDRFDSLILELAKRGFATSATCDDLPSRLRTELGRTIDMEAWQASYDTQREFTAFGLEHEAFLRDQMDRAAERRIQSYRDHDEALGVPCPKCHADTDSNCVSASGTKHGRFVHVVRLQRARSEGHVIDQPVSRTAKVQARDWMCECSHDRDTHVVPFDANDHREVCTAVGCSCEAFTSAKQIFRPITLDEM